MFFPHYRKTRKKGQGFSQHSGVRHLQVEKCVCPKDTQRSQFWSLHTQFMQLYTFQSHNINMPLYWGKSHRRIHWQFWLVSSIDVTCLNLTSFLFLTYLVWNWYMKKEASPGIEPATPALQIHAHPYHAMPPTLSWQRFRIYSRPRSVTYSHLDQFPDFWSSILQQVVVLGISRWESRPFLCFLSKVKVNYSSSLSAHKAAPISVSITLGHMSAGNRNATAGG